MQRFQLGERYPREMDTQDLLNALRAEFYIPKDTIYLDGNSLGLLSRAAKASLARVCREWQELAINGWSEGKPSWLWFGEYLGAKLAPLVGAQKEEVVVTNSTTINIHNLIAAFYRPKGGRKKIIVDALNFPTDLYAIAGQMRLREVDPEAHLVVVDTSDGHTICENDVIAAMDEEIAMVFLPSVLYRSGQLLDIERLTAAAHKKGILAGFDLAHSAGVIPHELSAWGVDFAVWCNYKWLNSGPGSTAAVYINKRHFGVQPGLPGWWGHKKDTQFDMRPYFTPADNAAAFQTGTIPMLSAAPLEGAVELITKAGIDSIRRKSLQMTEYMLYLLDNKLSSPPYSFSSPTPRDPERRGGHVALEHPNEAFRINEALKKHGVIGDFRPPNIIRLAPSPLYNTYYELWQVVNILQAIVAKREYEHFSHTRGEVT